MLTISNVTFTGTHLARTGIATGVALQNFDSGVPLGIQFASGTRAFGADFSSQLSSLSPSFTAILLLDNGETFNFTTLTDPNSTFFGFISLTPIRSLTFSDGGLFPPIGLHQELIANVYVVSEIPEPRALGLSVLGALFVVWRWHRFRKP